MRLSFNQAFRAPSFVNSYLDTTFVTPLELPGVGSFQFPTRVEGNRQLEAERLTAYEAGYTGKFGRSTLGAAVYLNRTRNMIQFAKAADYTSESPPAGWPLPSGALDLLKAQGHGLPARFTYLNYEGITDRGVDCQRT